MARGSQRAAVGLAILAIAGERVSAQQPPAPPTAPPTAWDVGPEGRAPAPAGAFPRPLGPVEDDGPVPVPLEVDPFRAIGRELGALAERGTSDYAAALRDRALDPVLRSRLVREPTSAASLVGTQEDARRRLARLSIPDLAELRKAWDFEVEAAGLAGLTTEARARELLANHPGASAAAETARWLGERCLERGEVEDALFFFRMALERGPPPNVGEALRARVLALRARPGAAFGVPRARAATPGLSWARPSGRRPLAAECDAERVYVAFADRLLALDRVDGRVRWSARDDEDADARVARGHGLVLRLGRTGVRARDLRDGAAVWALVVEALRGAAAAEDPADRIVDATPTSDGFALLATLGGVRRVILVSAAGDVRWSTTLWPSRQDELVQPVRLTSAAAHVIAASADSSLREVKEGRGGSPERRTTCTAPGQTPGELCGATLLRGVRCPMCGADAAPDVEVWKLDAEPPRAAAGDGRLACVGDRLVLNADGLVAALGLQRGELLWALDRGSGLGLGGRRTFVGLTVDAFVAHAITAAGLLVRLDPLDGRLLPTLPGAVVEPAPEALALALTRGAPVIGWRGADGVTLATGTLAGGDRPVGPGVVDGRALVLPVEGALLVLDVVTGERLGRVAWPLSPSSAAPRLVVGPGGVIVALGAGGVAVLEAGATPPEELAPAGDRTDDALIAELDAVDWRRRALAWRALSGRDTAGPALARVREQGGSAEVREVATELLERLERLARWRKIAPSAPAALVETLADGELTPAALRALTPHVARGPEIADAVIEVLAKADAHEVRSTLIELTFRAHEPLCGRIVAVIRNAQANLPLSLAATNYLVTLARGGFDMPIKRALVHPDELTRAMVQVVLMRSGDAALRERLRPDPAYWKALESSGLHQALNDQLGQERPDERALIDELTRALVPEPEAPPQEQGPRRVPGR